MSDDGLWESRRLDNGATVGPFSHLDSGSVIGSDVVIGPYVLVEDARIGDRSEIGAGSQLHDGVEVRSDVRIGPNVVFNPGAWSSPTVVESGAVIEGGAVILPGIRVGRHARVAAGAVVGMDVPPHSIVEGNPAQVVGYVDASRNRLAAGSASSGVSTNDPETDPQLIRMTTAVDMRGSLVALEFNELPFIPKRFFFVYGVPSRDVRGEHAHRICSQFLVCVRGSVRALTDDGVTRAEHTLDDPAVGLHMPPMTWGTQYAYSPDAVLVVFASHPYDPTDYIRDYSTFRDEFDGR